MNPYRPEHYLSDFRLLTMRRRRVMAVRRTRWWWVRETAKGLALGLLAGTAILAVAMLIYLLFASL